MKFLETTLKGAFVIQPTLLSDERGGFSRVFCKKEFMEIGHSKEFVQFNHSYNSKKGTVRGMHYQEAPHSEIKLIRCVKGAVYDVIIDIRKGSPTFMQWYATELSAANRNLMYVPEGFAHGFQTLEEDSELIYHHTSFYEPAAERGLRYNDELLAVNWPLEVSAISQKDENYPLLTPNFKGSGI
ncbi:MAG TPA: dTDP-4-dehydrorhamnose 3,5-epimerase [Bacteroidia bacterium]